MLENQIAPDSAVSRLLADGHDVHVRDNFLIVDNVAYRSASGATEYASIISSYRPGAAPSAVSDHSVYFTGTMPYRRDGVSLELAMVAGAHNGEMAGLKTTFHLSNKPDAGEALKAMMGCFYLKMSHYIRKLGAHVENPQSTGLPGNLVVTAPKPSVFRYPNMAVARSGLESYEEKLALKKIAIIGLGGTGSYLLDALAKTPAEEIHLYDGDRFKGHNAYRMPGAMEEEEIDRQPHKVDHFVQVYSKLRTGIISHPYRVDANNLPELDDCNFVFVSIDDGPSRKIIADHLMHRNIPFIDVGLGAEKIDEVLELNARVRVTLVPPGSTSYDLPIGGDGENDVYNNIQLAELNALNAMMAVIRYKQYLGFYSLCESANVLKYLITMQHLVAR